MNAPCRRNAVPFLLRISFWHTFNYMCKCSSSIFSDPDVASREYSFKNSKKNSSVEKSVMDSFTDNLLQEHSRKWESKTVALWKNKWHLCQKNNKSRNDEETTLGFTPSNQSESLSNCSDQSYIKLYLRDCVNNNLCPNGDILLALLHSSARNADKECILIIKEISSKNNPQEFSVHGRYDHYLAEAVWRSGNIELALDLFWEVYENNIILRRKIINILKILMTKSINEKGEAILVLLIKFSKKFVETYNDHMLLSYIFEICFVSEWYSDNNIATNLLEEFPELRKKLSIQVIPICSVCLLSNKLEVVHRLFEVLIKYEMKKEYEIVLRSLFDYACEHRDITACTAIIQSSQELGVSLTETQQAKFLVLFCDKETSFPLKKIQTPEYHFKF